ncbi:MAG: M3 family metallopeptidase [Chloroflexota bacterium]|nr:M3 family metallopeptidase [Chloroflexota bacterium]
MHSAEIIDSQNWNMLEPHFTALLNEDLTPQLVPAWLERWSDLEKVVWEARAGLKRDRLWDVTNEVAQEAYQRFIGEVFSPYQIANQELKTKLLSVTNYVPAPEHVQMLRYLRAEASLYRQENVPLQAEIAALSSEYSSKFWGMIVHVDGEAVPLLQVEERAVGQGQAAREHAWRLVWTHWRGERRVLDQLFLALLRKRRQLAHNAGFSDYRAYRWQEMGRLDYSPTDCLALHDAIETEIIPLSTALREQRRRSLGLTSIQPWHQELTPEVDIALRPFADSREFAEKMAQVYRHLDPELGALFERMRHGYLDLGARPGKPHGGEEWIFPVTGLPYIRAYTTGTYEDVNLLVHESGHAFHDALSLARQGLFWNMGAPGEFSEFAAIAMTYLAAPYLEEQRGGFYTPEVAAHVYRKALEDVVVKWLPSIALVDAFQHWIYASAPENVGPADLDAKWLELSKRFQPGIDWTELEQEHALGWQRVGILFQEPFYQIEYALAHLGALQVWQKAQNDYTSIWKAYREALSLGNTRSLPELYRAAGAELPFDREVVKKVANFLTNVVLR